MSRFSIKTGNVRTEAGDVREIARQLRIISDEIGQVASGLSMDGSYVELLRKKLREAAERVLSLQNSVNVSAEVLEEIASFYEAAERKIEGLKLDDQLLKNAQGIISEMIATQNSYFRPQDFEDERKGKGSDVDAFGGDPVNMATGNYFYQRNFLMSRGLFPLGVAVFYNSVQQKGEVLGKGWTHNYALRLETAEMDGVKKVSVRLEDGGIHWFALEESGRYIGLNNKEELSEESDGFIFRNRRGLCYHFSREGRILKIAGSNGNGLDFQYDGQKHLRKVVCTDGRSLEYRYDANGFLSAVFEGRGRCISFLVEEARLAGLRDENGSCWQFGYDSAGMLESVTGPDGIPELLNTFDDKGRITAQKLANGGELTYTYDDENKHIILTEPNGNTVTYVHDERMRHVETIYGDGKEASEYDALNRKVSQTDKLGNRTAFAYDKAGNLTKITNALGETLETDYNEAGLETAVRICGNQIFENAYDEEGNLVLRRDAVGGEIRIAYNPSGKPVTITQPDGSLINLVYDGRGNIIRVENPFGECTSYVYDNAGRVTETINARGERTKFRLDARGNITEVTNPEGSQRLYTYNACGRITRIQDFDGSERIYTYNEMGDVVEIRDPDGAVTHFTYDSMRCLRQITLPNGAVVEREFDEYSRLIREKLPNGGVRCFFYDANGNQTAVERPDSVKYEIAYDALNRPKAFLGPDGLSATLEYNSLGQITVYTDAEGHTEESTYDAAGRRIAFKDRLGNVTRYKYNSLGLLEEVLTPTGLREQYIYETGGRLIKTIGTDGSAKEFFYAEDGRLWKQCQSDGTEIRYVYDIMGRISELHGREGLLRRYRYDAAGRVIFEEDANGSASEYGYHPGGKLRSVTDALGNRTEYAYDVMGELSLISRFAAEGTAEQPRITRLERDLEGHVTKITDPAGLCRLFTYDQTGRILTRTDEEGAVTRYTYNALGQQESVTYADERSVRFSYDSLRRLAEIQDWLGATRIAYDDWGRIREVTDPQGQTVAYKTGSRGERTEISYPDGLQVRYTYDDNLRLSLMEAGGEKVRYLYGTDGLLSEKISSAGYRETYRNEAGRLAEMTVAIGGEVQDHYTCTYDLAGNRIGLKAERKDWPSASGSYQFTYDALNRLSEVQKDGRSLRSYGYDAFGNRISLCENGKETRYLYDLNDQLIGKRTDDTETSYTYDLTGNLKAVTENGQRTAEYSYDAAGKLAQSVSKSGKLCYVYNGLGSLVREERFTVELPVSELTEYVPDLTRQEKNILQKRSGNRTIDFLPDQGYFGEIADGKFFAYGHDTMGSVVGRIDPEAGWKERLLYDEFGRASEKSGDGIGLSFGFTEYGPGPEGLLSAGARQYSPEIGRFLARDRENGFLLAPYSLNKYTYCFNQPLKYVDADGNWPDWLNPSNLMNMYHEAMDNVGKAYDFISNMPIRSSSFGKLVSYLDKDKVITRLIDRAFEAYLNNRNADFERGVENVIRGWRKLVEYKLPWGKNISDYMNEFTRSVIGEKVIGYFDFTRDSDGVYHTRNRCWQVPGGYNDSYDDIFSDATSADKSKFTFNCNGETYVLWSWKGDYVNLGAGAETGIYRGSGKHIQCATDTGLVMSLTLYDARTGEVIFDYAPNDPNCWWINGFNPDPRYQDYDENNLTAVTTIDFSNNPELWEAFLKEYKRHGYGSKGWCVNEETMTARFVFSD